MHSENVYDIIGIGIGPFNLGLAALADSIPDLKCLFIDQHKEFNWHPGLMLDGARLQVPFYADLVTLADPCSKFSYLSFLKAKGRMFRFAILENNFILRKEYNEYCQWVIEQIQGSSGAERSRNDRFKFSTKCEAVRFDEEMKVYSVFVRNVRTGMGYVYYSKNIVVGVGSEPCVPACCSEVVKVSRCASLARNDNNKGLIFHSSEYLKWKSDVLGKKSVTIVGSGQSAAEIFLDLLKYEFKDGLKWYTRNHEFYPMDYSSFALEKTSPDYIDHFYSLPTLRRHALLKKQDRFYKGINAPLISEIYTTLYNLSLDAESLNINLYPSSELKRLTPGSDGQLELTFVHSELNQEFTRGAEAVILATGYKQVEMKFLEPVSSFIQRSAEGDLDVNRNYSIDRNNSLYVQNAEIKTHGFNAPDLGMGPYRNAIILNTILGYEKFSMEKNVPFQRFGID